MSNSRRKTDLVKLIRANLTDDLLKPEWRRRPRRSASAGHCYVATEALYHLMGGKRSGFTPTSGPCPGGSHWWLQDDEGRIIDVTGDQFTAKELRKIHAFGRGRGFMGKPGVPSARARELIARVTGESE